jgi:hypothetical protein
MKPITGVVILAAFWAACLADDAAQSIIPGESACITAIRDLGLPQPVKTKGDPPRAKWEQVDRRLTSLRERLQGMGCQLTFERVFSVKKEDAFFPLTNNLVRTAPDESLQGLQVFDSHGKALGEFVGRTVYERSGSLYAKSSYTFYYFQFRTPEGKLESTGRELTLDNYLAKWSDLKGRIAVSTQEQ